MFKFLRRKTYDLYNSVVFPSSTNAVAYKKLGLMERQLKVRKQEEDPRSVHYKYRAVRHVRMRSLSRQIGLRPSFSLFPPDDERGTFCAAAFGKSDNLARQ